MNHWRASEAEGLELMRAAVGSLIFNDESASKKFFSCPERMPDELKFDGDWQLLEGALDKPRRLKWTKPRWRMAKRGEMEEGEPYYVNAHVSALYQEGRHIVFSTSIDVSRFERAPVHSLVYEALDEVTHLTGPGLWGMPYEAWIEQHRRKLGQRMVVKWQDGDPFRLGPSPSGGTGWRAYVGSHGATQTEAGARLKKYLEAVRCHG
jgi:hypothetical protein